METSLRKIVRTRITKDYGILLENGYRRSIETYVIENYKWLVPALTIAIYGLTALLTPNTFLSFDSAKSIIDQRSANYAAITGTTIAVIGLLLSNLAKKRSFYYDLLFKKTFFLPILLYTLSGIAILIATSTIRDLFAPSHLRGYYGCMVTGCTVVLLIGLGLVFHLFRTIIIFTSEHHINLYFQHDLLYHQRRQILRWLYREISEEHLKRYLDGKVEKRFAAQGGKERIYDIDMARLARYIQKHPESPMPKPISLEMLFYDLDKLYKPQKSKGLIRKDFTEIFDIRKMDTKIDPTVSYVAHLDREFQNSISESNSQSLTDFLRIYKQMFELYGLVDMRQALHEANFLIWSLGEGIHLSITKNNRESFEQILSFIEHFLEEMIERENWQTFESLINHLATTYSMAAFEKSQNRITQSRLNSIFNTVMTSMDSLIWSLHFKIPDLEQNLHSRFYLAICTVMAGFYRRAIHGSNLGHFEKIDQITNKRLAGDEVSGNNYLPDLSSSDHETKKWINSDDGERETALTFKSTAVYTHHLKVLTRLWLYYLVDCGHIKLEQCQGQITLLGEHKCWLGDLIIFTENIHYFDRSGWFFSEFNEKEKLAFEEGEWILKSFTLEKLFSKDYNFKQVDLDQDVAQKLIDYFNSHGKINSLWEKQFSTDELHTNAARIIEAILTPLVPTQ